MKHRPVSQLQAAWDSAAWKERRQLLRKYPAGDLQKALSSIAGPELHKYIFGDARFSVKGAQAFLENSKRKLSNCEKERVAKSLNYLRNEFGLVLQLLDRPCRISTQYRADRRTRRFRLVDLETQEELTQPIELPPNLQFTQ